MIEIDSKEAFVDYLFKGVTLDYPLFGEDTVKRKRIMLLDNENKNLKVHEWIAKYTEEGHLNIVTGYFTVGALAYLSRAVNEKIKSYRFVLGRPFWKWDLS
ncbi:MAG: hypothetical protein QME81_02950 [bacterium]|nr:hypothetical protein [bacterium]